MKDNAIRDTKIKKERNGMIKKIIGIVLIFAVALSVFVLAQSSQTSVIEGTLNVIIGDPEGFQGEPVIRYYLFSNAQIYELMYSGEISQELIGNNVLVQGNIGGNTITATNIVMTSSNDGGPPTTGPQQTVVLLMKYNDIPSIEPQPTSFFTNIAFNNSFSLKTLWEENSYNALSVVNNGTYGWFTLPQTQAYYNVINTTFPNSGDLFAILSDAINVAYNNSIQIPDNSRLLLFVNNMTGCCAVGTLGSIPFSTPYGTITISVSWLPIWSYNNAGLHVIGHEYGHNLGFLHSGNVYYTYDSPWDTVSGGCNPQGANTITKNKIDSGWLTGSDFITIPSTQVLQTTIYPTTNTNGLRGVKIITPDPNIYFTIESRINQGHDTCLPNQGIIIHKVNNSLYDWNSKPIDATPGDNNLQNAQWNVGQTYNDSNYQFNIQVISSQPNSGTLISVAPQGTSSSSCGTISSPGYYALSNNVFSPGTCFTINSDNVNLDCQWNTITYGSSSPGPGITATSRNNIIIQNCFINQGSSIQYSDAISFNQIHQAQVLNSRINTIGHDSRGIYDLGNSQVMEHVYENNIINTTGVRSNGIEILSGGDNIVRSNTITTSGNWASGILVSTATTNTFTIITQNNVTTFGNSLKGVEIGNRDTNFTLNIIRSLGNYSSSLRVGGYNNANNYISDNLVESSGISSNAFYLTGSGNTITKNIFKTLSASNTYGAYIESVSPNSIYNNLVNVTGDILYFNTQISNNWNTTYQLGPNIIGGPYLGGNFYARTNGTGFSETCNDLNFDGICDSQIQHNSQNIDYLPLASRPPITITLQGSPNIGNIINISLHDSFHPGSYYILGASLSTQPPIIIGPPYASTNISIPLAQDFVFDASIFNPSSIGLFNSQGFLNQNNAVASLQIPNIASLQGVTVNFAFVTFNVTSSVPQIVGVSSAVPLTFLP